MREIPQSLSSFEVQDLSPTPEGRGEGAEMYGLQSARGGFPSSWSPLHNSITCPVSNQVLSTFARIVLCQLWC